MPLLIFGFRGTNAENVALGLASEGHVTILDSSPEAIESFIQSLDTLKPTRILGLGAYSGMGTSEMRIETMCSSQFRNDVSYLQKRRIPFFLRSSSQLKLTNSIGNSWCNLVSYKIVTHESEVPFTFLHVPKIFPSEEAIRAIKEQLNLEKTEAR